MSERYCGQLALVAGGTGGLGRAVSLIAVSLHQITSVWRPPERFGRERPFYMSPAPFPGPVLEIP